MLTVDCRAGAGRVILEARDGGIRERLCFGNDTLFLLTCEKTAWPAWTTRPAWTGIWLDQIETRNACTAAAALAVNTRTGVGRGSVGVNAHDAGTAAAALAVDTRTG